MAENPSTNYSRVNSSITSNLDNLLQEFPRRMKIRLTHEEEKIDFFQIYQDCQLLPDITQYFR